MTLTVTGWLQALHDACQTHGRPLPLSPELARKLAQGPTLPAARERAARQLLAQWWLQADQPLTEWQRQLSMQALALACPAPPGCPSEELLAPLLRALRQQGQWPDLADWLGRLPAPEDLAPACRLPSLLGAAALSRQATDGAMLQAAQRLLQAWSRAPEAATAEQGEAAWSAWIQIGERCLDGLSLARLAQHALADRGPAPTPDQWARLLHGLQRSLGAAHSRAWCEQAWQRHPTHPGIARWWVTSLAATGGGLESLGAILAPLDRQHPDYPACLACLGQLAFEAGDSPHARQWLEQAEQAGALDDLAARRLAHLRAREATDPPQPPDLTVLGPLRQTARPMLQLLQEEAPRHDARTSRDQLAQRVAQACAAFEQGLAKQDPPALHEASTVAEALWALANAGALELRHWEGVFPYDFGPDLGSLDPRRASLLCNGVLQHLLSWVQHSLRPLPRLPGAPQAGQLADALRLIQLACEAWWVLGEPLVAQRHLQAWRQQLGDLAASALALLEERCILEAGSAWAPDPRAPTRAPCEHFLQRPWLAWLAQAGVSARTLCEDAAVPGQWECVGAEGRVRVAHHAALATQWSLAEVPDLQVRHSHLLVHPQAGMLQPEAWHRQMGAYPFAHPDLLERGLHAALLRQPRVWRDIQEPVVVLANMDAAYHRNYYHWVVLTLSRIHGLWERGLLDGRRLLLPAELPRWMGASLQALGLPPDQVLHYHQHEALRLQQAWVAAPLEWASASLLGSLRHRLWCAAGLDPKSPPTPQRLLFLTRAGEVRRPLLDEAEIAERARRLGYDCVAPEQLSLLDQVRLFAQARAVAGAPGAAFTNLLWCQPGTRVLTLFKEEINGPTFLDLGFLGGQQHRWLQGQTAAGFEWDSVVTSPYRIAPDLAQASLQWASQ